MDIKRPQTQHGFILFIHRCRIFKKKLCINVFVGQTKVKTTRFPKHLADFPCSHACMSINGNQL